MSKQAKAAQPALSGTAEVYLLCQWHNCQGEESLGYDGNMVAQVCATKQLADQLLEKRGGHSYGYVTKAVPITNMRQAGF